MVLSLALLALSSPVLFPFSLASASAVAGVEPRKAALYTPISGSGAPTWKCLNDSRVIPFSAVNDDYCDCADGSDEPGTSACPNSSFYCINQGHIGSYISSTRVNDGLCEPECCDGSDEPAGVCPNICKQVGEAYRKKRDALLKVRKTGAKIRGTYIQHAQKEKKRLEDSLELLTKEVSVREKELARLEEILARTESVSHAAMEHKKQSPLYQSLLTHSRALKSLNKYYKEQQEREKTLADILAALKTGYNPNYQDMAVLEAVRGWDAYNGEDEQPGAETTESAAGAQEEEHLEEGEWSEDQIEHQLEGLINRDYESLLIEHDEHMARLEEDEDEASVLFDIGAYVPESLAAQYEIFRDKAVGWLKALGVVRSATGSNNVATEETNKARQARDNARYALNDATRKKESEDKELGQLFDVAWYGTEGQWKKLQNVCIEKEVGEYVYELCFFGSAAQKNKNGGSTSLGSFSSWNTKAGVASGSPEYYSVQMYTGGQRCWNGPERSVTLKLACGTENAILSVSEPEKCEYHYTATSPALCLPVTEKELREEL
ncbi:endoplasmic reticulum protein [Auricularia subglabra TFB-10046 SS5]|nr:endoplasmic reticulum protein [Auricularia subglabra TFB-10046 SS5]